MTHKPFRRSPSAPFMTSTLQQEAGRKLRFSSKRAMQVAQRLYEDGWITYMRTDSTTLSSQALDAARAQAKALYGPEYVPAQPRRYERKVKNAQEAHEAIRPAGETFRTPDEAARALSGDEFRLYDLIWKRTVASQMADATGTERPGPSGRDGRWSRGRGRPAGRVLGVGQGHPVPRVTCGPTWRARTTPRPSWPTARSTCPPWPRATRRRWSDLEPGSHATQPPARYTEASLVKAMEDLGVGRPSTYASVIATILDRGYVWKKGTALVPSFTAFAVVGLLERYFADLVDYGFTASMEDDLDAIASGTEEVAALADPLLLRGSGTGQRLERERRRPRSCGRSRRSPVAGHRSGLGLKREVSTYLGEIDAREINSIPIGTGTDGQDIVARVGPLRALSPTGRGPGLHPRGPGPRRADRRAGRGPARGPLLGPGPRRPIPRRACPSRSRPAGSAPTCSWASWSTVGRSPARPRCSPRCPRPPSPSSRRSSCCASPGWWGPTRRRDEEIVAHNGKFGPYLKKGTDTRSLLTEDQILSVTVDEALALFAQPKARGAATPRGRSARWGPTPTPDWPWWSRTAGSGPT